MKSLPFIMAGIASCLLLPPLAMAADTSVSAAEKQFMLDSAQAGMTEVKLGNVAETQSSKSDIKEFAKLMVQDHTKANNALKEVAKKKNVALPESLDAAHQAIVDELSRKKGTNFDSDYVRTMVRDHKKVRDSLSANRNTADSDLRQWVADTLPTVRHHYKMASDLNQKPIR